VAGYQTEFPAESSFFYLGSYINLCFGAVGGVLYLAGWAFPNSVEWLPGDWQVRRCPCRAGESRARWVIVHDVLKGPTVVFIRRSAALERCRVRIDNCRYGLEVLLRIAWSSAWSTPD